MSGDRSRSDIPLPLALACLVGIVAILAAGGDMSRAESLGRQIEAFLNQHETLVVFSFGALMINLFAIFSVFHPWLSQQQQGKRLRELTGDPDQRTFPTKEVARVIGLAAILSLVFFGTSKFWNLPTPSFLPVFVGCLVNINLALASAIISPWALKAWRRIAKGPSEPSGLKEPVAIANTVYLGTTTEENKSEQWLSIGERGLSGNVLITGSIGSGKTQGSILPYFDQILATFDPKPSVVAIDPKGTFIADAAAIAVKNGLADEIYHLKLGGGVSFNPIFVEDILKGGRFLDVAQMIRAAAINFSGRGSSDSPFWELSAFNLMKNGLVYVAAVHGYFTLADLYQAIVDASDDKLTERLDGALRSKGFDEEESSNIRHALSYFESEFSNFDQKMKTGILATATAFLNQFQEFQASRIFCPPKDQRTIASMDDLVDHGKILLFDIETPGLARAMGTFVKLLYQQSVLKRLTDPSRSKSRPALLIIDEYQDVVSTGSGSLIGDDRFLAKGREAKAITIVATQSLSSLENGLGRSAAARELCQNFRTRIACHSTDLLTIRTFQDLIGEEEREKLSRSFSEHTQAATRNLISGGFDASRANLSESVSKSLQRESVVTGKDFSRLNSFEALALVYDGVGTEFVRLNLKPYFLKKRSTSHQDLKKILQGAATALAVIFATATAGAFPNVCDVVKQAAFSSCMNYQVSSCTCPGIPSHPCARFSYYVPDTFVEVTGDPGDSRFRGLPGAEAQLSSLGAERLPYGTEGNDFGGFQARTLPVPLSGAILNALPCSENFRETTCFGAMSEHLGPLWTTGTGDARQPNFLLWALNPKACILAGAASSVMGGGEAVFSAGSASCSVRKTLPQYPPSTHSACNGWGIFFPRVGVYDGPSQTTAALMVAARMKSLSTEVFQSASASPDEKWQMIMPSGSRCFREGQNVGLLETVLLVNDRGRLMGRLKNYLFVTWRRVSCCKELTEVASATAVLAGLSAACQGLGGINP